jgi:cellulose synthase/poly-beta-1,6-N-acetylglucosamine synthase-like glycosyltransferase
VDDPRLRYVRSPRIGRSEALNTAIALSDGEYIAVNDADDLSLPHRLDYSIGFLRAHPEVAVVGTAYAETEVFHDRIPQRLLDEAPGDAGNVTRLGPRDLYRTNPFVHSTVAFRKAVWKAAGGYDARLSLCVDYDFFLRAIEVGGAVHLPGRTVLYYRNPASFYKRRRTRDYLATMANIKRRARRSLGLPIWYALYDVVPLYQTIRAMSRRAVVRASVR